MSNIIELENCPELNFIENMTLQETEDQMRELYAGYYRELTGRDPEIGDADTVNLLIKAFCAMEYQTMQYADAKGRMEMLKTSTGSALDALAALVGLTRKAPERATASVRFSLEEPRSVVVAIPAGSISTAWSTPRSRRARAMRMLWCKLRKPERRAAASFRVQSKYW